MWSSVTGTEGVMASGSRRGMRCVPCSLRRSLLERFGVGGECRAFVAAAARGDLAEQGGEGGAVTVRVVAVVGHG